MSIGVEKGKSMSQRMGEVLAAHGVLSMEQVNTILAEQHRCGKPFGVLAEDLYAIDPRIIEEAWAIQYADLTRHVDPMRETYDMRALDHVTRRQAWQFRVLPIRFDGCELLTVTDRSSLKKALGFANNVIGLPVYLVLSEPGQLEAALHHHYPMDGMHPRPWDSLHLGRTG